MKRILFFISILFISINSFGVNWIITDNGELIKIEHYGREVFNNSKGITQTLELPAKTGMNTTTVDKLFIGVNNDYPCQIAYNDVTVDGDTPTDLENFSELVNVILNNVSVGSTAPLTVDLADAGVMLAGVPAFPVDGQVYIINGLGITGVDNIRTVGIVDANTADAVFNKNCEAYLSALGVYVPCTYDVATNKINIMLETVFRVTQTTTDDPTFEVTKNDLVGVTFSASYGDPGKYAINPSVSLSTSGSGVFNEVYVHMTGTQVIGGDVSTAFGIIGGYYDEANDVMRFGSQVVDFGGNALTPTDGIINELPMYLICILSN